MQLIPVGHQTRGAVAGNGCQVGGENHQAYLHSAITGTGALDQAAGQFPANAAPTQAGVDNEVAKPVGVSVDVEYIEFAVGDGAPVVGRAELKSFMVGSAPAPDAITRQRRRSLRRQPIGLQVAGDPGGYEVGVRRVERLKAQQRRRNFLERWPDGHSRNPDETGGNAFGAPPAEAYCNGVTGVMSVGIASEEFRGYLVRRYIVTVGTCTFEIIGPRDCEELLDEARVAARFEQDGYLPYWAELWPAGVLLAQEVWNWGPVAPGKEVPVVLELGCGLGLASLVAVRLGYRVIASDYDEDALAFVLENARRSGLALPLTRYVDWRCTYDDLLVDRVIAGEVLYEERNLRPVSRFVRQHLRRGGFALICDACRPTADGFERVALECGLRAQVTWLRRSVVGGQKEVTGRLYRLEHAGD